MNIQTTLEQYQPYNEQETMDREQMLVYLQTESNLFTRENAKAHFTASGWVVNPTFDKVLMVYHNIYQSWSWVGGHADGDTDLAAVALREAQEETGLMGIRPVTTDVYSLEILPVPAHTKNGVRIEPHDHLNLTYLLLSEEQEGTINPEENSGVAWMTLDEAVANCSEDFMKPVYQKLNDQLETFRTKRSS